MKPFYVCRECGWSDNEYKHPHDDIRDAYYCQGDCVEKMQPAFLASDIEKLIKGRIQEYEARDIAAEEFGHYDSRIKAQELQSLLSALEFTKDGAEGKD